MLHFYNVNQETCDICPQLNNAATLLGLYTGLSFQGARAAVGNRNCTTVGYNPTFRAGMTDLQIDKETPVCFVVMFAMYSQ